MDICNVTKLPCAYCNPCCEHRVKSCLCEGHSVNGMKIIKKQNGHYELEFWNYVVPESNFGEFERECVGNQKINYCPLCGKDLRL